MITRRNWLKRGSLWIAGSIAFPAIVKAQYVSNRRKPFKPVASTPSWSPSSLSPILWYKADVGCTNISGSPCVNGDGVYQWQDQSGNSRTAEQATDGFRPVYTTNALGTFPALAFNGSDNRNMTYAHGSVLTQPTTFFLIFKSNDSSYEKCIIDGYDTSHREYVAVKGTDNYIGFYANGTEYYGTSSVAGGWKYAVVLFDGANSYVRVNGEVHITGENPGTHGWNGICIGGKFNHTQYPFNGYIYEVGMINSALGATDRTNLELYLASRCIF